MPSDQPFWQALQEQLYIQSCIRTCAADVSRTQGRNFLLTRASSSNAHTGSRKATSKTSVSLTIPRLHFGQPDKSWTLGLPHVCEKTLQLSYLILDPEDAMPGTISKSSWSYATGSPSSSSTATTSPSIGACTYSYAIPCLLKDAPSSVGPRRNTACVDRLLCKCNPHGVTAGREHAWKRFPREAS